jgi:hypothetical protein
MNPMMPHSAAAPIRVALLRMITTCASPSMDMRFAHHIRYKGNINILCSRIAHEGAMLGKGSRSTTLPDACRSGSNVRPASR